MLSTTPHRITQGSSFQLKDHPTEVAGSPDKDDLKASVVADRARIAELQELLFAEGSRSLLLIFQAMDAAGKDSAMAHVLTGVNPQGIDVHSFKQPSKEELSHDFLWRHRNAVPASGIIGVHNRSHYEEVLVVKVHPEYLTTRKSNGIREAKEADAKFWEERYATIRAWEEELVTSNTTLVKFFLHMGKKEQKKRFLDRIDDTQKQWKFSLGDVKERAHFDAYMAAYERAIQETATEKAPWYVVPADEQWESRAIIARVVRETLEAMKPSLPKPSEEQLKELEEGRRMLLSE